ncbi:Maf family protein [Oceanicoccus sagamiensis]|uniref:7-methyl-GTP pyrophosphatase n=1 Tax=Oceanicoccus sagamiensis TaxID=716816 RepID=A0A1X9NEE1_9GAMM|nr:nucleoside triphosphate pyrophosphatase [Oceanicoccus sagamiensis]ARN75531.1 septum formation inhibitor Maf [Oceanicoccus sagamiensis]
MLPIILASSSPYRRELLGRLAIDFVCSSPDIDETALPDESPQQLVERLAQQKAQAVAADYPQHLIIGSDQVASLGQDILTKPGHSDKAQAQLAACSGKTVTFYTGLSLLNSKTGQQQSCIEPFSVKFRHLDTATIERYIAAEQPFDCAGSFKMEGLGISLFEQLQGDDPNSLVGLPLIKLVDMLKTEGINIP